MNYLSILLGNLCSLLGMATDSVSSTRKTTKEVLLLQSVSQLIYCIGSILLKGYSSAVQSVVSILRNFVALREISSQYIEWLLIAAGVIIGICCNNLGLIGYLPIIANLQYSLAVFRFRNNERALKISFLICNVLFAFFNIAIFNIVGFLCNVIVFTTTFLVLVKRNPDQK